LAPGRDCGGGVRGWPPRGETCTGRGGAGPPCVRRQRQMIDRPGGTGRPKRGDEEEGWPEAGAWAMWGLPGTAAPFRQ
jgi:hypothetical protein